MEDRIKLNGIWYVKEEKEELNIVNYLGCDCYLATVSIESSVLIEEDGSISKNTFSMDVIKDKHKETWDNEEWIKEFPKSLHQTEDEDLKKRFTKDELIDIERFISLIIDKGWI